MLIDYGNFDLTRYEADTHLRSGVLRLPARRGKDPAGLRNGALSLLGYDLSRPGQEPRHHQAEDEPADVREERDAAPVRGGAEQPDARLDQLVQEPHSGR